MVAFFYTLNGEIMKVKLFDCEDEGDLEEDVNGFLANQSLKIVDIKYQVSVGIFSEEQVFCFSAMVIYYDN